MTRKESTPSKPGIFYFNLHWELNSVELLKSH